MKRIHRFKKFTKTIAKGIHVEFKETIEIPSLLRNKEYKKAGYQVIDIFKMVGLTVIWIVPGGAVITTMILKFSHRTRPSAFQPAEKKPNNLHLKKEKDLENI